jgi:hypothetical protein
MSAAILRSSTCVLYVGLLGSWLVMSSDAVAQNTTPPNKPAANKAAQNQFNNKFNGRFFQQQAKKPMAPMAPRSALLTTEEWQKAPLAPVLPAEIDQLVLKELQATQVEPARRTTDEQFVRRVFLDLTGRLPEPADVREFSASTDPSKRAQLIDRLLASDEYAQHWGRYWRDVVSAKIADRRGLLLARGFELWMTDQLKRNVAWDAMARAILTAEGEFHFNEPEKNGAIFFIAAHRGESADAERAAETARVFLGIQLQCAECHDHPSDQWKRVQFHELAAYFARVAERPIRDGMMLGGVQLVTLPAREHEMVSKEDPKKSFLTQPRFLDGGTPGPNLSDKERRRSLAFAITDKNNYWFPAAFVNRMWGELMGQSFYAPIDDMGPQKEAVFPHVLTRLTSSFRATKYDVKGLLRTIMNTDTYQRQIRLGESADHHLHFAAAYPTRLRADALWDSLINVLGRFGGGGNEPFRPFQALMGRGGGFEGLFKSEFDFDPSLKADEVEGTIPQALMLMNNPLIHGKIEAKGSNVLARLLQAYPKDDDLLRSLYLKTLARKPTDREVERCREYVAKAGKRAEAFEDILWALINSTEFQTKR